MDTLNERPFEFSSSYASNSSSSTEPCLSSQQHTTNRLQFPDPFHATFSHEHPPTPSAWPPQPYSSRVSMPVDIRSSSVRATQTDTDSDQNSIKDSVPPPPPPPPATVREKRVAREKEEKQRRQAEKRKSRQKKADSKYHGNLREALDNLKDTLSEGPGVCPTTISEVYIAAGQALIKLVRQYNEVDPDEEDGYTSWAGKPTCKSNHQGSTESDSEDSDDRPYKRRRRSDPGVSARTQLQAEQNYREHRSDALRWLSKVVFGNPSDKAVCEVIESAIIMIQHHRKNIRARGKSPVA